MFKVFILCSKTICFAFSLSSMRIFILFSYNEFYALIDLCSSNNKQKSYFVLQFIYMDYDSFHVQKERVLLNIIPAFFLFPTLCSFGGSFSNWALLTKQMYGKLQTPCAIFSQIFFYQRGTPRDQLHTTEPWQSHCFIPAWVSQLLWVVLSLGRVSFVLNWKLLKIQYNG